MLNTMRKMAAAAALAVVLPGAVLAQSADYVFTNGKVYTVNEKQPWAEAIAIKGTDIVSVGDNEGAKKFIGDGTEVADLDGKLMLPGLVSGHEHPLMSAAFAAALYIPYSEDKEKMLTAVRDYIKNDPTAARMSFGGSYEGRVDITRHDIDKISPDEPFVMIAASAHGGWINTKALEALGVVKGKPDPIDQFERDKDGTPTGYVTTSAAAMYTVIKLELIKKEALVANLPKIIAGYNSFGITAVNDAGNPPGSEQAIFGAVAELEKTGRLNLRISTSVGAQRPVHLDPAFVNLNKFKPMHQSEMFTVNTLKMHGGSPDGHSSPLLEPYSDRPDYRGPDIFPRDVRIKAAVKAAKLGYDIHTHAMGDRAIRDTLDAYQAIRQAGLKNIRLSIGHSTMIHPDDKPRYKQYDVTANTFASKNAVPDKTVLKRIGKERLKYWQPMRSLLEMGIRLSMSADAPTAPLDPYLQMEVAMLRKEPDQKTGLYPEKEAITIKQVIRAYTMGAAYQIRAEKFIGSLEVGKRADLVIVNQDLFKIDPSQVHNTKAVLTILNGNIVYRRDASDQR